MVKMLILAVWVSAITAAASMGAIRWQVAHAPGAHADAAATEAVFEYRKTKVINVPIVGDGALLGYVIVQFLYGIDTKAAEKLNVSPDAFILDYAFRALYGDPSLDFRHLDRYDMSGLTARMKDMLNDKLGAGMIKEVLIQDFSYMPKDQTPH